MKWYTKPAQGHCWQLSLAWVGDTIAVSKNANGSTQKDGLPVSKDWGQRYVICLEFGGFEPFYSTLWWCVLLTAMITLSRIRRHHQEVMLQSLFGGYDPSQADLIHSQVQSDETWETWKLPQLVTPLVNSQFAIGHGPFMVDLPITAGRLARKHLILNHKAAMPSQLDMLLPVSNLECLTSLQLQMVIFHSYVHVYQRVDASPNFSLTRDVADACRCQGPSHYLRCPHVSGNLHGPLAIPRLSLGKVGGIWRDKTREIGVVKQATAENPGNLVGNTPRFWYRQAMGILAQSSNDRSQLYRRTTVKWWCMTCFFLPFGSFLRINHQRCFCWGGCSPGLGNSGGFSQFLKFCLGKVCFVMTHRFIDVIDVMGKHQGF